MLDEGRTDMKKKILIALLIIIIIALFAVGYFVFKDMRQEKTLKNEISQLDQLVNSENIDLDAVNDRLDRTVTTGDYATVEAAFKAYLSENFDNIIKITDIMNDGKLTTLLSTDNYKNDGKDFTESKKYISDTITQLNECKNKYAEFLTEEKAMSYINDKGLDSYYTDLYKNELMGDMEEASEDTTVQDSIDGLIDMLNRSDEVLTFLADNKNSWEIQDDSIVFDNETLSGQYDQLIDF